MTNIKLTFDGFGINDDGEAYKSRLATFSGLGKATPGLAELLVAAPDLLAALKDATDMIETLVAHGTPISESGKAALASYNAAIAKAEGR